MKKMVSMLLVIAMALSILAGCGGSSAPGPASTPNDPAAPDSSAPPAQAASAYNTDGSLNTDWIVADDTSVSGKVNFWIAFKGNQGMDAMIKEFNSVYPNIEVTLNSYNNNSDGNISVNTAMDAGEVDVLVTFGVNQLGLRSSNGLFMDLTQRCQQEGIDLMANWGTDFYKYNNAIYTLPCGGWQHYVAINMNAWKEAGLGDLPTEWTWDEYLAASEAMTKRNADGSTAVYGGSDYSSIINITFPYSQVYGGTSYYKEDGTAAFDDPIIINSLKREVKAELEDKIWFSKATYRGENIKEYAAYCQGQIASTVTCNVIRYLHDTESYPGVNWVTGFAPFPVEEKGQANYMSGISPYSHAGISTNCQDEEAAWLFLKWYSTYGVKYLTVAGHQSNWKGADSSQVLDIVYGSKEKAAKYVDVDSFLSIIGNSELPFYIDNRVDAFTDITRVFNEYALLALNGEMDPEAAMLATDEEAEQLIKAAQ